MTDRDDRTEVVGAVVALGLVLSGAAALASWLLGVTFEAGLIFVSLTTAGAFGGGLLLYCLCRFLRGLWWP